MHQFFTLKQVCEKWGKRTETYARFVNLLQEYDRINKNTLFRALMLYIVAEKLVNVAKNMFFNCGACESDMS